MLRTLRYIRGFCVLINHWRGPQVAKSLFVGKWDRRLRSVYCVCLSPNDGAVRLARFLHLHMTGLGDEEAL